jgi:hypothetical protein
MFRSIDVLTLIGIVLNLVKATDLILRPHQQRWVQAKFESLTLLLEYTRPLRWFAGLSQASLIFIVYALTGAYVAFRMGRIIDWLGHFIPPLAGSREPPFGAYVFGIVVMLIVGFSKYRSAEAMEWIIHGDHSTRAPHETIHPFLFVLRFLWITLRFCFSFVLVDLFVYGTMSIVLTKRISLIPYSSFDYRLFRIALFSGMFYLFSLLAIVPVCTLISGITIVLFILEILLKVSRAVCWRIVEYNKGVVAAITLILTVALGALDIYLKATHRAS